jgi:GNAT superfamily N-acetyltransferase
MKLIQLPVNDMSVLIKEKIPTHTNQGMPIYYYAIIHNNIFVGAITFNHYPVKSLNQQMYVTYIRELHIFEEHRNTGIGTMFMKYFIEYTRKCALRHSTSIQLEAMNSKEFWSKCNFIPTGEISPEGNIRMIYQL